MDSVMIGMMNDVMNGVMNGVISGNFVQIHGRSLVLIRRLSPYLQDCPLDPQSRINWVKISMAWKYWSTSMYSLTA